MNTERFRYDTNGKALPENIVSGKKYRFTVLTDRLIRMEYDPSGNFEDRATQVVFFRDFPKNSFSVRKENGILEIDTGKLRLRCREESDFSADTLSVELLFSTRAIWHYGDAAAQLGGTARTLDRADGAIPLENGVCARCGFALMPDKSGAVLTDEGWFAKRSEETDLYFFGYGHDYREAVADFYRLTGAPPLLPDYALGNWWSRYYRYTQDEYCALMERFERENIPFSVAVLDMDWHTTDLPEDCFDEKEPRFNTGWTGYSWNKELFPDYRAFLRFLKEHHLKTALNLHPAQGVRKNEEMYPEMARACGIDPETGKNVKFDCLNPEYMEHYFDILHHPYEKDGVNFWWMDWQQGTDYWWIHDDEHEKSELEVIDPLWLLNHLHIADIRRSGKRPMFFSRYAGLGSHRYPVGFSGDTIMTWKSLDFQPYFTANASNAGYGWWSHDIGGHMGGYADDELQIRWLQFGVMSPINRLHACSNPFSGKEPWKLNPYAEKIADHWLRLRHRLFPYLYTMNYRCHTELAPLIQPMYYVCPEAEEAYGVPNEYLFGSELLVSPITSPNDARSQLGKTELYFPEGDFFDVFSGWHYGGGKKQTVFRSLEEMPIFAKAGAIVPTQPDEGDNRLGRKENLTVYVFPGADGAFSLYEDEGDGEAWETGKCAFTDFSLKWGKEARFVIGAARGDTSILPEKRSFTVVLRGFEKGASVTANVGGKNAEITEYYDEKTHSQVVSLPLLSIRENIELTVQNAAVTENPDAEQKAFSILQHMQGSNMWKMQVWGNIQRNYPVWYLDQDNDFADTVGALKEFLALRPEKKN